MLETHNLKEFQEAARVLARGLTPLPHRATVVGLVGNLGAGKTTFVQAVANALGINETLNSPTFLILKSYPLPSTLNPSAYRLLHHIDAYRLKKSEELKNLGFEKLLADPTNLILIEWSDKVADLLPPNTPTILFEYIDEETRQISL